MTTDKSSAVLPTVEMLNLLKQVIYVYTAYHLQILQ